jgi:ABC-2 type transport system ATP-binding protein
MIFLTRRLLRARRARQQAATPSSPPAPAPPRRVPLTPPGERVIVAEALVKRYGSLTAVDGISFEIRAGQVFGMLGPNGAGKTTTLEMLEGLRNPDGGSATVLGRPMPQEARAVKERIGVQLQSTALPAFTKVAEAIDLFGAMFEQRRPTEELLAQFDLVEKAGANATDLSGGQMQRLSLALALVNDPELVFLDEPTTGLDPAARQSMWKVIEDIRAQGKTVVLTTHYMEEAERLCDFVAVIDHGSIAALDTPAGLIAEYAPGTSIQFAVAPGHDASDFRGLPEAEHIEVEDRTVRLTTRQPERVLAALFDPAAPWNRSAAGGVAVAAPAISDLRVRGGTLEDVFLNLTGRRLRE